ncbi:hypothetical protein HC251_06040 [Iamia sp. SCSIO 61187]|uniref:hypothetical protein n=1 Tax=Iamia sp. SCSIO 61187 TaxID=2722752 RepID=UPI001C6257E0|nr:hypothetical protein [Iamia sp. SCSIO 61187]QYG92040.1 hypothetical protein HC251_06040 [Iamia sp. SCSIO 61187]
MAPHRRRRRSGPGGRVGAAAVAGVMAVVAGGCGGGPDASVGVVRVGDTVEIRAKACGDGGIERADVVDPAAPEEAVWSAVAVAGDEARRELRVADAVAGYEVTDRRGPGGLPDRRLRLLVEGPDGARWGGPRFTPSELEEGRLRVAGRDVPLAEWEAEPARCPEVGVGAALVGGVVTGVAAGALWLLVRAVARVARR